MRLILAALLAAAVPAPVLAQAVQEGAARDNIDALIAEHARANKVPAEFVHRVVKRESNYNSRAKGGSALGLMQIKHATARGLGYSGDAAGLYDPDTNLKYGIAYLAGAYRAAKGDLEQAYRYYNRGYYYVAKRLGIEADVPQEPVAAPTVTRVAAASTAKSATGFDGMFALRGSAPAVGSQALAYAAPGTARPMPSRCRCPRAGRPPFPAPPSPSKSLRPSSRRLSSRRLRAPSFRPLPSPTPPPRPSPPRLRRIRTRLRPTMPSRFRCPRAVPRKSCWPPPLAR